jgi:dipeptidyl aminopeptidase/acylaminoacyl peptidase
LAAGLGCLGLLFPAGSAALTPPEAPAKVYFSNGGRIISINADGSGRTVLTRHDRVTFPGRLGQTGDFSPEVSPDNSRMVYSFVNSDGPDYSRKNRVMLASADGSGAERILADRPNVAQGRTPTWTPNGQRLVAIKEVTKGRISTPSVVSILPDGTGMRTLVTYPKQVDRFPFDERLVLNYARMSPEGDRLLVEVDNAYMDNDTRLEVVDLASGKRRSLGDQTRSGSWSADGSSIIYVSSRGSKDEFCEELDDDCLLSGDLFASDADGGDRRRLTTTAANEDSPSWSPDGGRVLFTSNYVMPRSKAATEVYSMKADGTCRVALTNGSPGSFTPVWAETGSGAQPVCGQAPPPVLTEIRPRPLDSFRPVYWAGQNVNGKLLSGADVLFGYGFTYDDCDLTTGPCGRSSWISSFPACEWEGAFHGVLEDVRVLKRRGGAAVFAEPGSRGIGGLSVLAGGSFSFVLTWGERSRARASNLELVEHLRRLSETHEPTHGLPAARLPASDLRNMKKAERAVRRQGSVREAALRLERRPRWIRQNLRMGRVLRSLGPLRSVKCPR